MTPTPSSGLALAPEPPPELDARAADAAQQAEGLAIRTVTDYEAAAEFLKSIKGLAAEITTFFAPLKRSADDHKRTLLDAERQQLRPLQEAEQSLKTKMIVWKREEEKRQAEIGRVAQEAARREAEEQALQQAVTLEASGQQAAAEAILEAPVVAPIVSAPAAAPKVDGISFRKTWKAEVHDLLALVRYVGEHPENLHLLKADTVAIGALARGLKDRLALPGVTVFSEDVLSGSRG